MAETNGSICGLILAAGKSSRMGQPKLDLPWQKTTVLGSVINNLYNGGVTRVLIVINPLRTPEIPPNLPKVEINWQENPSAETEDMLVSIQTGIKALPEDVEFVFICLGDQPTIQPNVIKRLIQEVNNTGEELLLPSYRMRRGHPWVVKRNLWVEILNLEKDDTVRTFINSHVKEIHYINFDIDPPEDMDTPEDYLKLIIKSG